LTQPGFYASRQACEAALPGEVEAFQAATGLEPLYTPVCMDLGGFNNRTPWMFRIEAVGSAEKVPLLEQADIFGTPAGFTMPAFLEATTEGIKDLGVDVRLSKYESTVGLSHLVYFLYADSNVFLSTETFATLPDSATCDAELGRLKESLFETNNIISYCSTEFPRTTYDVSGLFLNAVPYAVVPSLETFESYSACTRGRLNAINAAVADGMVVEDGLCSLAAVGRWKVMLLTVARD